MVAHLPTPLSDIVAAQIGSTSYLVGGYDGASPQSTVCATQTGTSFRRVAQLPVGLRYPAVTTSGGDLVVAGGQSRSGATRGVYRVDPRTGSTRRLGSLPRAVSEAAAVSGADGRVYVLGGRDAAGNAVTDVMEIDPARRSIRRLASLSTAVADAAVARSGVSWWLIGGWRRANLRQILAVRSP